MPILQPQLIYLSTPQGVFFLCTDTLIVLLHLHGVHQNLPRPAKGSLLSGGGLICMAGRGPPQVPGVGVGPNPVFGLAKGLA